MPEQSATITLPDPTWIYSGKIHEGYSFLTPVSEIVSASLVYCFQGDERVTKHEVVIHLHDPSLPYKGETKTILCTTHEAARKLFDHVVGHFQGGRP